MTQFAYVALVSCVYATRSIRDLETILRIDRAGVFATVGDLHRAGLLIVDLEEDLVSATVAGCLAAEYLGHCTIQGDQPVWVGPKITPALRVVPARTEADDIAEEAQRVAQEIRDTAEARAQAIRIIAAAKVKAKAILSEAKLKAEKVPARPVETTEGKPKGWPWKTA